MPSRDDLKRSVSDEIDRRGEELIRVAKTILDHPEPGFREIKTAAVVDKVLGNMGVARRGGIAITGIKGYLEGGAGPGPTIGVMGEHTHKKGEHMVSYRLMNISMKDTIT